MAKVIDLTNSTWKFIGDFDSYNSQYIEINVNFTSNDFEYTKIAFEPGTGLIYFNNRTSTIVYSITDKVGVWVNEEFRTIVITGGEDVTNSTAIANLNASAVYISGGIVEEEPEQPEEPEPEEPIYTASVSGLGNENPSTVEFAMDLEFLNIFGTDGDSYGNDFIKIPTMYRKINSSSNGQITGFTMATGKIDNSYEPYSVFVKPNGELMPYVWIGKYINSSQEKVVSVNSSSNGALTLSDARLKAQSLGEGFQIYDWQFHKLIQDLCLLSSQTIKFADGTSSVFSYLGLEGFDKSVWLDGVNISGLNWVFSYDPTEYVDGATSSSDSYTVAGYDVPQVSAMRCISKLGYDESNPFFNFPEEAITNASYSKYYGDGIYISDSVNNYNGSLKVNIGSNDNSFGIWYMRSDFASTETGNVRLCYRPLGKEIEEPDIPVEPDIPDIPDVPDTPVEPDDPTEDLEYKTIGELLTGIADSIRIKKGTTNEINAQKMPKQILSIETGANGVPIEISTLYSALLVAENEGKVYKYGGKLYRIVADVSTDAPTDLTNVKITVPSGWSATADYGLFDAIGYVIVDDVRYDFLAVHIGYTIDEPSSETITFISENEQYTSFDDSKMLTIVNTDLSYMMGSETNYRQWFIENGATFDYFIFQEILSPSGTLDITANGEVDVKSYEKVNVNVKSSGAEVLPVYTGAYKKLNVSLITFTIDETSYSAEEGMTWKQWVNSSYNTGGFSFNGGWGNFVYKREPDGYYVYNTANDAIVGKTGIETEASNYELNIMSNGVYKTKDIPHAGGSD